MFFFCEKSCTYVTVLYIAIKVYAAISQVNLPLTKQSKLKKKMGVTIFFAKNIQKYIPMKLQQIRAAPTELSNLSSYSSIWGSLIQISASYFALFSNRTLIYLPIPLSLLRSCNYQSKHYLYKHSLLLIMIFLITIFRTNNYWADLFVTIKYL